MAEREAKKQRIARLQQYGINNSKLAKLLDDLKRDPEILEQPHDRHVLDRVSNDMYKRVVVLQPLPMTDDTYGPIFQWPIASVPLLLQELVDRSPGFKQLVSQVYADRPCMPNAPWSLLLDFDEATPGMLLRQDNKRKSWTFFVSLREFGAGVLQHQGAWLPLSNIRSDVAKRVVGGFPRCSTVLLRFMFVDGDNMKDHGFILTLHQGPVFIFIKHGINVADTAALQRFWSWRGASGLFPCFFCGNVTRAEDPDDETMISADSSRSLVDIRCTDSSKFECFDDDERCFQADLLTNLRPRLRNEDFGNLEKTSGLSFNIHSPLWDMTLRTISPPVSASRYDPTHVLFSNGVVGQEMSLFLRHGWPEGLRFETIRILFDADWHTRAANGRGTGRRIVEAFNDVREKHFVKTKTFSPSASEALDIVPAFRFFFL